MQERHNSSALAMELRLSCTNPLICNITMHENSWHFEVSFGSESEYFSSENKSMLNSFSPGNVAEILKVGSFPNTLYRIIAFALTVKSLTGKCNTTSLTDQKSSLVQIMAWCQQVTSHHPSQHWPKSMSPYWYGIINPQCVTNTAKLKT